MRAGPGRTRGALALGLLIAAGAAACGKSETSAAGGRGIDSVLGELAVAGLAAADVAKADGAALGQGECKQGKVAGVGVTLCSYPDEGRARAAEPAGLAAVGDTTGAALSRGRLLLVVADRDKADPSGKTIDRITKVFLQKSSAD